MKVLIGYDGSECADAALGSLQRAGLPADTHALVVSVASVWPELPESFYEPSGDAEGVNVSPAIQKAHTLAGQAMSEARQDATAAAQRLAKMFPGWRVEQMALAGSIPGTLVQQAERWQAELLVVGSHGRSGVSKLFFGSVSQKVMSYAHCSVRIVRCPTPAAPGPLRLVIGVDGSADAAAAVEAVCRRSWPAGTEVRVVAALDARILTALPVLKGRDQAESDGPDRVQKAAGEARQMLSDAGLMAADLIREGDPKRLLPEEAQRWGADCIFVGARGMSRVERFLLGTVSAAIASRAPCSVEVVRRVQGIK